MRALTLALAVLAAALALECAHLAQQLDLERRRTRSEVREREAGQVQLERLVREQRTTAKGFALDAETADAPSQEVSTPAIPAGEPTAYANDRSGATRTEQNERDQMLSMLHDPGGRELLRAQELAALRAQAADLAQDVGLSADEYERLLALLADQALERMDLAESDDLAPAARGVAMEGLAAAQRQDVVDLLGEEKTLRYEEYLASGPLRAQVRQLRGRLGDEGALTGDQGARLTSALREEGARFEQHLQEQYAGYDVTYSTGTWYGGHFMASDARGTSVEEQILPQMEDYSDRMLRGAATVLTASQLEVFTRIQNERLAGQRVQLRAQADEMARRALDR